MPYYTGHVQGLGSEKPVILNGSSVGNLWETAHLPAAHLQRVSKICTDMGLLILASTLWSECLESLLIQTDRSKYGDPFLDMRNGLFGILDIRWGERV